MDVLGGAGICRGPSNIVGNGYMGLPIAITVEGANILTRSMITFGQGLNRSHPNLIKIINTIEKGDDVKGFTKEVGGFMGHLFSNVGRFVFFLPPFFGTINHSLCYCYYRSLTRAVTRPRSKGKDLEAYYEAQLSRLSANFAVSADLALVSETFIFLAS